MPPTRDPWSGLDPETVRRISDQARRSLQQSMEAIRSMLPDLTSSLPWVPEFNFESAFKASGFANAGRRLRDYLSQFLPPNWTEVGLSDALEFVAESGWPIVWLPRAEIVEALVAAPEDRDAVIVAHMAAVLDDAETCATAVSRPELAYLADCAREAISAMRDGHGRAAQTLAAAILTAILQATLGSRA